MTQRPPLQVMVDSDDLFGTRLLLFCVGQYLAACRLNILCWFAAPLPMMYSNPINIHAQLDGKHGRWTSLGGERKLLQDPGSHLLQAPGSTAPPEVDAAGAVCLSLWLHGSTRTQRAMDKPWRGKVPWRGKMIGGLQSWRLEAWTSLGGER